jgi:hypothetical protein
MSNTKFICHDPLEGILEDNVDISPDKVTYKNFLSRFSGFNQYDFYFEYYDRDLG